MTRTLPPTTTVVVEDERKRSVWKPLAAAGLGGAVLVATGFGVFAQLQATATGAQAVDSGTLLLTMADNGAGFSQPVSRVAPGDTVRRHVTLTNTGTLAGQNLTLAVAPTTVNPLVDATRGLQAVVSTCTVAWTSTGTCSGTSAAVYTGSVASLATAKPLTAAGAPIAPTNGNVFLQVALSLPDAANNETSVNGVLPAPAGGTIQGLTNTLGFTFTEVQRSGTDTAS